jgi:hypothetical protein
VGTASRQSPATPHHDPTLALVGTRPSETRIHDYDEVILAAGMHGSSRLSLMGWDPLQQLRRRWGERLIGASVGDR